MTASDRMVTPVGRFISGSITEKQTKDTDGRDIPPEKQLFKFGVAFVKNDPAMPALLQSIATHAIAEFATMPHVQQLITQHYQAQSFKSKSGFSWKISDGDAPDAQGKINENTAGHWCFWFSSSFPIDCVDQTHAAITPETVKRGYYIDMGITVAGNGQQGDRVGIYMNPKMIRLIAFGKEITGSANPDEVFAGHALPTALPAGASLTPIGGGALPVAGVPPVAAIAPAIGAPITQPIAPVAVPTAPLVQQPMIGSPGNVGVGNATVPIDPATGQPVGSVVTAPVNVAPVVGFAGGVPVVAPVAVGVVPVAIAPVAPIGLPPIQ